MEITAYIKKIKIKKAPGYDGVTNKMTKNFTPNVISILTHILNAMLILTYFPNKWKTATIIPIKKPGKNGKLPVSYRPISLLPILGKLGEIIIRNRLINYLEANNIMIPHQFGFTKQLSTTHQLLRVTEYIAEGLSKRLHTGAMFLDIAKAFDKVWINGLLYKLFKFQVPDYIIHLIHSYLDQRSFAVKVRDKLSTVRKTLAGTPQGSVLGPTLFNLFMNDIPIDPKTCLALFADDTAILCRGNSTVRIRYALQNHINQIEEWLDRWKVDINVSKSCAVYFSRKKKKPHLLHMYGTPIPWSNEAKYLGVILDKRLTWRPHLDMIKTKFRKARFSLISLLGRRSPIEVKIKLLMYKVLLRPIITYAAPIWGSACKSTIEDFEKLQNFVISAYVTQARWFVRTEDLLPALELPTLKEFMGKLAKNFYETLPDIDNTELQSLVIYDHTTQCNRHRPRASLSLML